MKNVVKCYKHFFGYFYALKIHGEKVLDMESEHSPKHEEKVHWNLIYYSWDEVSSMSYNQERFMQDFFMHMLRYLKNLI